MTHLIRYSLRQRQDNDVANCTSLVYVEIGIELSWTIGQNVVYYENQTGQRHDQSYRCDLYKIRYWTIKTNQTVCVLW